MIKNMIVGIALLSVMPITQAEVDWTPRLTVLQDSCTSSFHVMDELPKKYQTSILKKDETQVKNKYSGNDLTTTYYLKDATAFGLPLDKLKEDTNDEDFHYKQFSMVFKDVNFMKLRPSFYYTAQSPIGATYVITADNPRQGTHHDASEGIHVKYKNTSTGYDVDDQSSEAMSCQTELNFDKASKTLSCSMFCG
ncbi:hypothetical protein [Psychrobacter sp. DM4]|uniref:hypothetical protein n=1 Tax=Psychrobacter sp. DM4 TaxID=3440637 RepID=UPI003F4F9417